MFQDISEARTESTCLKLNKSLYGRCDSPRTWWKHLSVGLKELGFEPSPTDPGIYYGRGMVLALYVDDLLAFCPNNNEITKVFKELQDKN